MGQEMPGPGMQQRCSTHCRTGQFYHHQCCSAAVTSFPYLAAAPACSLQHTVSKVQPVVPHLNKHFLITTEFFNLIILTVSTRNILGTNKHRLSDADGSGRTSLKSLIILLSPDPDNKKEQPVLGNVNTKSLPHTGDRARRLLHRPDMISLTPRDTDDHNKSKYKMTSVPL